MIAGATALSGCADTPAPVPVPAAAAAPAGPAPQRAAAPVIAGSDQDPAQAGATLPVSLNDPSAPVDTPLCGTAARENNGLGQSLLPRQYAEAGQCASFACYDPATATYLGADGYRHVCR